MKKRELGRLAVSEIGIGCMGFSHGYGQIPNEEYSVEAIRTAFDAGCTFYDTAEVYGAQLYSSGHNERILGKAVREFRDRVVIATKFHFLGNPPDSAAGIETLMRTHLAESMKNLQTDRVELYYLHRIHRAVPIETVAEVMGKFIREGLIGGWGLSQVGVKTIAKAHAVTPLSAVQNLYNMLERDAEKDVIPFCLANRIGFVPFSPVASGFLSGKITPAADFSHPDDVRKFVPQLTKENMAANKPILDLVQTLAEEKDATGAQIALAWILRKSPNIVPIPGSKNRERILENLGAAETRLSDVEFERIESALSAIPVHGHRGQVEFDGDKIEDWGKEE
ncbi:MAG: aldo/keto reductase [Thermoguttaceae bacterium]|nr:aldo/keto reductase [Thermoguttaceae bacterium]